MAHLMQLIKALVIPLLLSAMALAVHAGEPTRIAAAADLRYAMDAIVEKFKADYPAQAIEVIYGSSGRFSAQIENGAPFDLFFSADIAYPRRLQQAGHISGAVIPYAVGRIVLWSNTVDAAQLTLDDLRRPEFRHIAIANPRHAPYGARAEEALRAAGLWEAVASRLVFGENIAHTMQLVESGAASVGIIALSLALNPATLDKGGYYLIDDNLHNPLEQGFVITKRAANNATAQLFADYMGNTASRSIMGAYGFVLPGE